MKLALVGQSFALRNPAAACQQTLNLLPQFIDDPNEQGKNKGILVGAPGYHLATTLAYANCRGVWSGGGVLRTVGGSHLTAWDLGTYLGGNPSSGSFTQISDYDLGANDSLPAQMFGNGNQLLVVANGLAYVDNGPGPVQCRFLLSGTVNTSGTAVTWASGDQFTAAMVNTEITIDQSQFLCTAVGSPTSCTLSTSAGTSVNPQAYTSPAGDPVTAVTGAYLDGYGIVQRPSGYTINGTVNTSGTAVTYISGDVFDQVEPGDWIAINGVAYQVQAVASTLASLTLLTSAGAQTHVSWGFGPDLGRQFNVSYPDDFLSWDPLDYATKEGYPDYLQSVFADDEQLYLLGTESIEIWQDTGNVLFPFQRVGGAMTKEGSMSRYAPAAIKGKVYMLGGGSQRGGPIAYRIDGFTLTRISTHAEEAAWSSNLASLEGAIGYAATYDGHQLWVVNFTGNLNTWVYDQTASEQAGYPVWFQLAKWTPGDTLPAVPGDFLPYPPQFHTFIPEWGQDGMHIGGDYSSGKIWELNLAYSDADGADTAWVRILPHLYAGGKRQFFGRMTLEMATGTTASASVQPAVCRDYSDDRGNTFINPVEPLTGGSGVAGANSQRVFWPANGSSRDRVFRYSSAGQAPVTLIDLELDVEVGDY